MSTIKEKIAKAKEKIAEAKEKITEVKISKDDLLGMAIFGSGVLMGAAAEKLTENEPQTAPQTEVRAKPFNPGLTVSISDPNLKRNPRDLPAGAEDLLVSSNEPEIILETKRDDSDFLTEGKTISKGAALQIEKYRKTNTL